MTAVVVNRVVLCANAQVHVHYMTVPGVSDVGGNVVVCTCRVHEWQSHKKYLNIMLTVYCTRLPC